MAKPAMKWTAIALTCQNKETAYSCQKELDFLQKKGFIDADVLLLAVEDPKATIGSGGATMNALLVIAEHLSARQGYTGRNYPYDPCGRAFVAIPAMHHGSQDTGYSCLMYNINSLLDTMTTKISPGSPPGVWICSTDMFLTIESQTNIDWEDFNGTGICGIAVPGSKEYARNHGVYKINKQACTMYVELLRKRAIDGDVKDIVYRGTKTAVEMCSMPDDSIALVTGVVFISASVAEKLLVIHVLPPIGGCTYMGLDSGEQPIQFSLFFDFLLCMASEVTEDDFVNGSRALAYGSSLSSLSKDQLRRMASLRQLVWKEFRGTKLKAVCLSEGKHDYMSLSALTHHKQQIMCPIQLDDDKTWIWKNDIYSHVQSSCSLPESSFVINSKLTNGIKVGEKCAITHSELEGPFIIGKDSILKGIDFVASKQMKGLTLQDGIIMQGINIQLGGPQTKGKPFKVYTVMGKFDDLKSMSHEAANALM
ncbi:L-fucose kinase-like [Saccoglossus kowalevskii]